LGEGTRREDNATFVVRHAGTGSASVDTVKRKAPKRRKDKKKRKDEGTQCLLLRVVLGPEELKLLSRRIGGGRLGAEGGAMQRMVEFRERRAKLTKQKPIPKEKDTGRRTRSKDHTHFQGGKKSPEERGRREKKYKKMQPEKKSVTQRATKDGTKAIDEIFVESAVKPRGRGKGRVSVSGSTEKRYVRLGLGRRGRLGRTGK